MARKKKYENAEIAKGIIAREFKEMGDIEASVFMYSLDFEDKVERNFLKKNILGIKQIFDDALKELGEKEKSNVQ